jgi:hypothetical protein
MSNDIAINIDKLSQFNSEKELRIQLALDNWDEYVSTLSQLSDKQLSEKLDLIHIQSQIAFKNKNESASQLLEIWWQQTVEARILKAENNIADSPNEIEVAIADIATTVAKAEERLGLMDKDEALKQKVYKPKIKEDHSDQIRLF